MHTAKKAALVIAVAGVAAGASVTSASAHDEHEHVTSCSSVAAAKTALSPGLLSGNAIQAPINAPVNLVGNTIDVVGILNPAFGNTGICS